MFENKVFLKNAYFIIGNAYAGKSTLVKELAMTHNGIACEENYHDSYPEELDAKEFPGLTYSWQSARLGYAPVHSYYEHLILHPIIMNMAEKPA